MQISLMKVYYLGLGFGYFREYSKEGRAGWMRKIEIEILTAYGVT